MRILFVVEQFEPDIGGLATSGTRIARTLAASGHEVDVFVLSREIDAGLVETDEPSAGLTVHRFGRSRQQDFSLQQALIFLEWLHDRRKFGLVWAHYAMDSGFTGIWFACLNKIASVVSVRGNDLDRQLFPPGDLSRLNWMLLNATSVVSVSHDLAAKIKTLCGRDAIVLHNSVDADLFQPLKTNIEDQHTGNQDAGLLEKYQISADEMVLVFSGELRAKKGLPMLIECFRRIARSRPARLLIIGEIRSKDRGRFERETEGITRTIFGSPAEVDNLAPQISDSSLHHSGASGIDPGPTDSPHVSEKAGGIERVGAIIVTGHLPEQAEVVRHLRLGDVFLLPSLWDGLPNSLLEAMAAGVPVVASDAGAICEVVTDRQTGLIVPRAHLHQMADRIDEFFSRPSVERQQMTDAAREYVIKHHSPETERRQLNEIVEKNGVATDTK